MEIDAVRIALKRNQISLRKLKTVLRYDPSTGFFTWVVKRNGVVEGKPAGCASKYVRIKIDGVSYSASCMAWLWMTGKWPASEVDHKDLNKHNNAWNNLRAASRAQNTHNTPKIKTKKTSSYKGVSWHKWSEKWEAKICVGGRQKGLGRFDSELHAYQAYVEAAIALRGEFARVA
jgi:hypothetical protein